MTSLQTVLVLSATLILCGGARVPRQASLREKARRMPSLDVCGISNVPFGTRIIGGEPAVLGEFPWMVVLGYVRRQEPEVVWLCGGSLITDQHVLTAAHCLHPSSIKAWRLTTLRLGELDLNSTVNDEAQPQDFGFESFKIHEDYNIAGKSSDIALVKLNGKVTFTNLIRPICLSLPEFDKDMFVGHFPIVAGWGRTTTSGPKNDTRLIKTEVEIQDSDECRQNITSTKDGKSLLIDTKVICAASKGKDACQGDSGGPLMIAKKLKTSATVNYFQMGLVSYGFGCAVEGYPGVYTRVVKFMRWIMENVDI